MSVTLGVKFYSEVSGKVTGVRFFKGPHNIGTHVGHLWSSTGSKLAEVTFTGEAATGWQQANFPTPVNIAANTTYVVSYLAPRGYYALDQYFSWPAVNPSPLHVSGSSPGVFAYGSTGLFPTGTWNSSNYWVDLVFVPGTTTPPTTPPTTPTFGISGRVSGSAATVTLSGTAGAVTTTDSTGNYQFTGLTNGLYVVAPSKPGYTFTPSTAAVSINGGSVAGINFTATAAPPVSHSVSLGWVASTSNDVVGYNVYRANASGGPYAKINGSLIGGTSYVDSSVAGGLTYFYVATAVDSSNDESEYSTQASAVVPM